MRIVLVNHGTYDEGAREVSAWGPFADEANAAVFRDRVKDGTVDVLSESYTRRYEGASVLPVHAVECSDDTPTNAEIMAHHLGMNPEQLVNALVIIGVDPHGHPYPARLESEEVSR